MESGAWEPGALFPSERELEERFGVSRTVVRAALDMLEDDGEINRVRGSGTFVSAPKARVPICGLLRALLDPPVAGLTVSILSVSRHRRDTTVAGILGLGKDASELSQVTAILSVAGEPLCLLDSYVVLRDVGWLPAMAEELKREGTTTAEPNLGLAEALVSIESSRLSVFTSSQLGARPGPPAIVAAVVQRAIPPRARRPRPVEFTRLVYRGDRVKLELEVD